MVTATAELHVEDLTIEYSSGGSTVRPVDRLSVHAPAGALVLLLGPSGCGKTSLLSCLAGILRPTAGRVRFGDIDVTALDGGGLTAYRRHQVGIVFQAFNLVASLTAIENVMVPLRAAGYRTRQARVRAQQLLDDVELGDRSHHRPGQLSGGQQQRVAIARALALDPPMVVADEPTAHLDQANLEGVLRLLRRLTTDGRIVVVSTHDDRLLPLADQTVELAPRRPVPDTAPAPIELVDRQVLFRIGDPSDWVYTVTQGAIDIIVPGADGAPHVARTVTAGQWFGEMGPLFHLPPLSHRPSQRTHPRRSLHRQHLPTTTRHRIPRHPHRPTNHTTARAMTVRPSAWSSKGVRYRRSRVSAAPRSMSVYP